MIPAPITNYVSQGLALLTSQFQNAQAPQLQALLSAYLAESQLLENAIQDVITYRQLANLIVYSPLVGTFTVHHTGLTHLVNTSVDQTNVVFPGARLTFATQPTLYYTVQSLTSNVITLTTGYTGLTTTTTTATQVLTNANMDVVGNLVGQLRLGQNDLNYLSVIALRIAINRGDASISSWSNYAAILSQYGSGISYYETGNAAFWFGVWDITLNPNIVAQVLSSGVPNGVGPNTFAYTVWPDGNDFQMDSLTDTSTGELGWGSHYTSTVGGLLVAAIQM